MASIFNTTCPIRSAHCDLYCAATGLRCSNLPLSSRQDRRICFNHPALVKLCNCIQHRSVYQSEFNTVFAMSILGTHLAEAKSMSGLYLHCLPAAAAYCLVTVRGQISQRACFSPGESHQLHSACCLFWLVFNGKLAKKRHDLEVYYPLSSRILTNTPFTPEQSLLLPIATMRWRRKSVITTLIILRCRVMKRASKTMLLSWVNPRVAAICSSTALTGYYSCGIRAG